MMSVKSTSKIRRSDAIKWIDSLLGGNAPPTNKDIEDQLERILDINNEKSRYYFDNFMVVDDDYVPDVFDRMWTE